MSRLRAPELGSLSLGAAILAIAGAAVLLRSVWHFFAAGRAALAPIDPPRHLVVRVLYPFTRNPTYNGILAVIAGGPALFRSLSVMEYALLAFVLFHLFVVLFEEPTLASRIGESYRAYRQAVPRWGLTVRPYHESTGSTA